MARVEMASQAWGWITDTHGQAVSGITATLKNLDGTNATTWSAQSGGTSSTASLTSNSDGTLPRYVDEGTYTLTVGTTTRRVEAVSGHGVRPLTAAAINTQLQAAKARGGGTVVLTDNQTYDISEVVLIPSNCTLNLNGATLKRVRGAAITMVANEESFLLTGTDDTNVSVFGGTLDGNSPEHTITHEQGVGCDFYGLDGLDVDLDIVNMPYSGFETGANAAARDNVGQVVAAGQTPGRPPRGVRHIRGALRVFNCGWQEQSLVGGGTTGTITGQVNARTLTYTAPTPSAFSIWAGLKVGIGFQGFTTSYELNEVASFTFDGTGGTITFTADMAFAHTSGTFDGVKYWADAGFGVALRQPVRHVELDITAEQTYLAGAGIGQIGNIKYEPLNDRDINLRVRLIRCGVAAPALSFHTFEGIAVSGYVGDPGGRIYTTAASGQKVITLEVKQGKEFYVGEHIWVGNPGAASIEEAVIASISGDVLTVVSNLASTHVGVAAGTLDTTSGSATAVNLATTVNSFAIGQGIDGLGIPADTTITNIVGTTVTMSKTATVTATGVAVTATGEQVFMKTSSNVYVREAGFASQRGLRLGPMTSEHGDDSLVFSAADSGYRNFRHEVTGFRSVNPKQYGVYIADANNIDFFGLRAHGAGANDLRMQQVLTEPEQVIEKLMFFGGSVGSTNLLEGTYKSYGCDGLVETTEEFTIVPLVPGGAVITVTDPGTAYVGVTNSAFYQENVDNSARKYRFARIVARVTGNEAGATKGIAVFRGATQVCDVTWSGTAATSVVGAWVAFVDTNNGDQAYSIRVKGSSATEDITVNRCSLQLKAF